MTRAARDDPSGLPIVLAAEALLDYGRQRPTLLCRPGLLPATPSGGIHGGLTRLLSADRQPFAFPCIKLDSERSFVGRICRPALAKPSHRIRRSL